MSNNIKKIIKNVLGIAIILGIAFFLTKVIVVNWNSLKQSHLQLNYRMLLLSLLPLSLSFYLGISAWRNILKSLGHEIKWTKAFWTVSGSHLAKFIPGHVLALGGRIWLCRREKIPESISATGIIIEMVVQLAASIFVFFLSLSYYRSHLPLVIFLISGLIFVLLMAIVHPKVLPRVWKYVPKIGRLAQPDITYKYQGIFSLLFIYIIAWSLQGITIFILTKSLYPGIGTSGLMPAIGAYGGAYALGFVSIITPGGLGVREGILSFLLKFYIPAPVAVIVAVLSRLCFTLFDVLMTLFSLKFKNSEAKIEED
ncbi:MAG: lysylphosphatidylglycerol synthase transmembrane domain-containing protein [Candidatus Edwardsbacteria bacterium]|nr:lysylphosphatidylglycerol synthase transmembrane domain-containing protein [Candidatus Edwardsbacteria bacterium]